MQCIEIHTSVPYCVHIGGGLLPTLGEKVSQVVSGRTAAIVSDRTVWARFGDAAVLSLEQAGFRVCSFVFTPGESSKNPAVFLEILNFLAENKLQRTDCVIALGGGVTGDLAGFCAACYLRGIAYIPVPTSLLAMVDASVGGKTAIDLPAGKNLCGAFHQPRLVLCDTDTLAQLPLESFRDGCAEIIKYGILYSDAFFSQLEQTGPFFDRAQVIARCVEYKRDAVLADERDNGPRRLLNLGHTFGHAIEAASGYTVSHGRAVAMGIAIICRAAGRSGICQSDSVRRILELLEAFGLPTNTDFSADVLLPGALQDKKLQSDHLCLILPRQIGSCFVMPMQTQQLAAFLQAGLSPWK